jgi:hypothetical protein
MMKMVDKNYSQNSGNMAVNDGSSTKRNLLIGSLVLLAVLIIGGSILIISVYGISEDGIREKIVAANSNITSYAVKATTNSDINMTLLGEAAKVGLNVDINGKVDIANRKLMLEGTTETSINEVVYPLEGMSMYIVGNMTYSENRDVDVDGVMSITRDVEWYKYKPIESEWNVQDQLKQALDIVAFGEIESIDTEKEGEREFYVVEINPDLEKIEQNLFWGQDGADILDVGGTFDNLEATIWADKETLVIDRGELVVDLDFALVEDSLYNYLKLNMVYGISDVNEAVEIILPEEVENAFDIDKFAGLLD